MELDIDRAPAEEPASPAVGALRVLVVARQPVARVGLRALLANRPDIDVVGQAASIEDVAPAALETQAQVVLASWDTADVDAVAALAQALSGIGTPLVLLADPATVGDLQQVLYAGARGILLAEATEEEIAVALHAVAQGLLVLDPSLGRAPPLGAPPPAASVLEEPLTERERQVLELLALGLANKAIARRLAISEHTVKFHVGSILGKLDASSRTDAVARAARRGLLAL